MHGASVYAFGRCVACVLTCVLFLRRLRQLRQQSTHGPCIALDWNWALFLFSQTPLASTCCGFVVQLAVQQATDYDKSKVCSKSTTSRSSRVWAYCSSALSVCLSVCRWVVKMFTVSHCRWWRLVDVCRFRACRKRHNWTEV